MEFSLVIMSAPVRVVVPLRAWIVERHESSAENRRPTVGQRVHPKVSRSSVDAHCRRA